MPPASDHEHEVDFEPRFTNGNAFTNGFPKKFPSKPLNGFHSNGAEEVVSYGLSHGITKTNPTFNRADEMEELLDAVKSLVVPYIREADVSATFKPNGQLPEGTRNTLVDSLSPRELIEKMQFSLPMGEGKGKDGLLDAIQDVLKYSVNTWDQGFMDKLTASTNPVGVISEIILGVLNTNVHVYHVSPALTVIEKITARSLAAQFGFTSQYAGGVTCQGGSASNMTSLVIARNALYPETKLHGNGDHRFAVFTSAHGHFSVEKAAVAIGMGASAVVCVPVDKDDKMDTEALRELIIEAKEDGRTPLYVNATIGTTVLGEYDPVEEIREICDEFGMWMHCDGSWGGAIAFSRMHKYKLAGCEKADSLTINPQKVLNVPMTCSFLLTNDLRRFHAANSLRAGYLFHDPEDGEVWDLADLTLQCGRRADALKMALAWIYYGSSGFEEGIDHAYEMSGMLADLVDESPDFELISSNPPPSLQVCFYYTPGGKKAASKEENTSWTRTMVQKMLARGFMFDFAPGPRGHFFRVVVNCQTLAGTVDGLFKGLEEVGREVVPQ